MNNYNNELKDICASTRSGGGGCVEALSRSPTACRRREADGTASYIQVEVRRARRARLPTASSPAPAPVPPPATPVTLGTRTMEAMTATAAGEGVTSPTVLACSGAPLPGGPDPAAGDCSHQSGKNRGVSALPNFGDNDSDDSELDSGVERVEVFYFERGMGAWLAARGAARETAVERGARAAARRGGAALEEALAAARLAVGAPLGALVAVERAVLVAARGAVVGAVQTAADHALKPALALLFNAALHPPLVLCGNVSRAVRLALRPLWAALGDALQPLGALLAGVRLVHVHIERPCHCARAV